MGRLLSTLAGIALFLGVAAPAVAQQGAAASPAAAPSPQPASNGDLFYAAVREKRYAQAIPYGKAYLAAHPENNTFALDLAYAELNVGDVAAARALLPPRAAYLRAHPKGARVWMDVAYADGRVKRYADAIADIDTYLTFAPNDATARLQRRYYTDDLWGGPRYQAFGYGQYEGRFNDTFYGADQTYALAPGTVQPYMGVFLGGDTRSGAPGSPQIYADNVLVTDFGLRAHLGPYAVAFVEGGAGIGLRGQGTIYDLRYGLRYFERWGQAAQPYTTVNASLAYYSRYAGNTIAYYTVLHDFGGRTLRPVVGLNGGLDAHNVFGNNYLEAIAGLQTGTDAMTLRVVQVEGAYLTRGLIAPSKATYEGLRAGLYFGIGR